jgi:RNA polymerase sigma factor (sigma-70 family)
VKDIVLKAREDENVRLKLLKDFEPLIKKAIKLYVKDKNYFEDAMQQGYLTILSCIKSYDVSSKYPFEAYLKRAVIYAIRDFSKRIKNNLSLDEEINEDGGCLLDIIPSEINIEEENLKSNDIVMLKKALDSLSLSQRQVIEDVYFKGKSMKEVSKHRRCHYMSVVKLKERALNKLRDEIG